MHLSEFEIPFKNVLILSVSEACSPDATSTKTASKSAGSRAPNEPRDPELLQLLEAHGALP